MRQHKRPFELSRPKNFSIAGAGIDIAVAVVRAVVRPVAIVHGMASGDHLQNAIMVKVNRLNLGEIRPGVVPPKQPSGLVIETIQAARLEFVAGTDGVFPLRRRVRQAQTGCESRCMWRASFRKR